MTRVLKVPRDKFPQQIAWSQGVTDVSVDTETGKVRNYADHPDITDDPTVSPSKSFKVTRFRKRQDSDANFRRVFNRGAVQIAVTADEVAFTGRKGYGAGRVRAPAKEAKRKNWNRRGSVGGRLKRRL